MFEAETKEAIIERLKKYFDELKKTDASPIEGTFAFDTLAANATEFENTYAEISLIMEASFPETSWGKYLDYLADELAGLSRREATPSVAVLTISGTKGITVPAGSIFASESGIAYATDEDVVIGEDGTIEAKATATTSGSSGNVAAGYINSIPVTIYGVSKVTNAADAYDGYDEETDASLLERLLFAVRQPATSGNVYHYLKWVTSVSGVGAAKVIPLWNGNGTVKVIIVDSNKDNPSEDLLEEVREVIKRNAPIGADVTVTGPILYPINIALKVTKGTGNADGIKEKLTEYFKESVFPSISNSTEKADESVTISFAQVGRIILDNPDETGVKDYSNLTINGGTENITVGPDNLPVVGTVTINA